MSKAMRKITYYENILEFKESTKEPLNLNEINNWQLCRTCLIDTTEDDVDLEKMSIMDVMEGSFLTVKDMLTHTTNLKTSAAENLSLKVCKECFSKITSLYYFSIQVRKADKILIRLDNKLKGNPDKQEMCTTEEMNCFNENEIPENSVLIEVEELFDIEKVDVIENTLDDNDNTCIEEINGCELNELEKTPDSKHKLEYCEEISELESEVVREEELDADSKSNFSEEDDYLYKEVLDDTETSERDSEKEEAITEIKTPKKRKPREVTRMSGYKHKQPRITSPLLHEIVCEVCQNAFERQQDLVNHVRSMHPNSKAYKCRVCGNLFSHIQSLSRHMNTHKNSVVLHECEYCMKPFIRVDDLKRHIRVHTGERPYACSYCQKSYQQLTDLKLHQEKHFTTKTYECNSCELVFKSRNGLYMHKKKHHKQKTDGNENRYVCSLCENSFDLVSELRRHEKKHFLPKILKCNQCEQTYRSSNGLYVHKKKCHNNTNGSQTKRKSGKENLDELLMIDEDEEEYLGIEDNESEKESVKELLGVDKDDVEKDPVKENDRVPSTTDEGDEKD